MSPAAEDFNLFEAEETLVHQAGEILASGASPQELESLCRSLLGGYCKLLRETRQLIRLSDRRERELGRLNRKLIQLTSTLSYQAERDALTGAYNKGAATRRIEEALQRDEFGLLIFDIDFFKKVNDQHGHPCGDRLLQGLVDLIQESLGPEDMLGRFGGEEFVILLKQPSLIVCKAYAERLRRMVEVATFECGESSIRITLSFGLALCQVGESFATVYQRADQALYAAKRGGRNRVEVAE